MKTTGIIGHRGASGLALENSMESLRLAMAMPLDAIELDIHRTKDGQLVVLHDSHTGRIAKEWVRVSHTTLAELQTLTLKDGQSIPTLKEVFQLVGSHMPLTIDIKDSGCSEALLALMQQYPRVVVECTSLKYDELTAMRAVHPQLRIFVRDLLNPFEVIQTARRLRATGISLNVWLMNPLTYFIAVKSNLQLRVYTVNSRLLGNMLHWVYPGIAFYTDHPERFVSAKKRRQLRTK